MKYYYNSFLGERGERFFENMLVYPDGDKMGQPFKLDLWQKEFLRDSLGWYESETGDFPENDEDVEAWELDKKIELKHQNNVLKVAKGNGKTPLLAGMALFFAGWCGVKKGEIYMAALARSQAGKMLEDCKSMIRQSSDLQGEFVLRSNHIMHKNSRTKIFAASKEAGVSEGARPDKVIIDEDQEQPHDELINTFVQGLVKRRNAQIYYIGTAGNFGTYGEELYKDAKKIKEGIVINPLWNIHIYEAQQDISEEDALKEENWYAPNPGLGTIKSLKKMRRLATDAATSKAKLLRFMCRQLNIWVAPVTVWMTLSKWDRSNKKPIDLAYHEKNKTLCFGGMDLGSREDLSAAAFLFVEEENGKLVNADLKVYFWCPNQMVHSKQRNEQINYPQWVEDKLIFTTPGDTQDKDEIFRFVENFANRYNVKMINADPSFHDVYLASRAENCPYQSHSQQIMAMSEPTKAFMNYIFKAIINHEGNPVLRWQSSNGELYQGPHDNVKLVKSIGRGPGKGKKRNKIDGLIASVLAVSGYLASKNAIDEKTAVPWWETG